MGNLKNQALNKESEDVTSHELTDAEYSYLNLLKLALQYNTLAQKIMSGFLYYVSTTRLGYPNGTDLQFELDFDKDDKMLTVKLLPSLDEPPIDK